MMRDHLADQVDGPYQVQPAVIEWALRRNSRNQMLFLIPSGFS
jgi:hypothetical protein